MCLSCKWFNEENVKLLVHKIWITVILENFMRYKDTKEVVSAMYLITNFSTTEIIKQNQCQMRFLDKSLLKQNVDEK